MTKPANTARLLQQATAYANDYLSNFDKRPVFPKPEALTLLDHFDEALPDEGMSAEEVLSFLHKTGDPAIVNTVGGRYFGFVTGSVYPIALAANWLAGTWDENPGVDILSPLATKVGAVTSGWLKEILHLPEQTAIGFVTGATMANFSGLAAARHALLKRKGWNVEEKGLQDAPKLKVIVGEEVHVSVLKALSMLGLGSKNLRRVPVDDQGRMRPEELPKMDDLTILCLQAGNVNSGAIDPIEVICRKAEKANAWVHVDGAFGLWAAASPKLSAQIKGIERVDSCATDLHKWLNVPYDSGLVFVKEGAHLPNALSISGAAYLPGHFSVNTPEMSRRAREIEVWAALKHLGKTGVATLIERCCEQARLFAKKLDEAGFEILNEVNLNQVLVSFGSDKKTKSVMLALQRSGVCWCGGTVWKGRFAMRISVSSWTTSLEDVERSVEEMLDLAKKT